VRRITWPEVVSVVVQLASEVVRDGPPELLVAVERGGLVPGVMLSHRLGGLPLTTLGVRATLDDRVYAIKGPASVFRHPALSMQHRNVLLIDDIVGSGRSLAVARAVIEQEQPSRLRTATCFVNADHTQDVDPSAVADYVGRIYRGWLVFPWEIAPAVQSTG
jgi:uncharacterized protein